MATALSTDAAATRSVKACVLGGGIGGCSAVRYLDTKSLALVEMGRGLGGRSSTRMSRDDPRIAINHGAPSADIRTREGASIMKDLESHGYATKVSGTNELSSGILEQWRGDPNMSTLCEGLTRGREYETYFKTMVHSVVPTIVGDSVVEGWTLLDKNDRVIVRTDWLIVSGSGAAHPRWRAAFKSEPPLIEAAKLIGNEELNDAIERIGSIDARPVQVAMMAFDTSSISDNTSIISTPDDDVLDKLVMTKSKDGRLVSIVAHSTTEFANTVNNVYGSKSTAARIGGATSSAEREQKVLSEIMTAVDVNLKQMNKADCPDPTLGPFLHRWGNAFPDGEPLPYNKAIIKEAKLAFCGDYVGEKNTFGSIEGALLSGKVVGEELSKLLR
ncbi:hypothetical protein THAOC_08194 [Thalassiosira oceanica]|uniref:Amine oxidase domain-containing protein n=1 Tax=Thalassiosira oceanica TaxID=159749 RepID=K0SZN3_THAOC|nr:hypothetical protein THAOC_08194 [Thalassiosira oceanica]|eukprot:EJK70449.1 hypothetical protein THAOC_08194 [Thalassiosira oceanica]